MQWPLFSTPKFQVCPVWLPAAAPLVPRRSWADNQLTGTLPLYINGIITMSMVALQNNKFTGGPARAGWVHPGAAGAAGSAQRHRRFTPPWGVMSAAAAERHGALRCGARPPAAGKLPPDWGMQVFLVDNTVNSTQALEKL